MKTPSMEQANTFGDWAYLAINQHFAKILKHEAGVLKDQDPEELHQMRVGMRRLRSAMTGFASALDLPKAATQKMVGKVACILGQLRDLDVLEDTLKNKYQPSLPKKEQKHLNKALKVLAKRRKKTFKQVKELLNDDLYLDLKISLHAWLEKPSYQAIATIPIKEILPDLLLPQVSKLLLHPGWLVGGKAEGLTKAEVEKLLVTEGCELHELRKEAKRSRYQMELFTQFYGEEYHTYLQEVKEIQTVLGDIQDSFVLTEFLREVFGANLNKKMPNLVYILAESRHEKWQEWEKIQQKFLDEQIRQDFHFTVLQPTKKVRETPTKLRGGFNNNILDASKILPSKPAHSSINGVNLEQEELGEKPINELSFKEIVTDKPAQNGNSIQLNKDEKWQRWYYINLTRGTS